MEQAAIELGKRSKNLWTDAKQPGEMEVPNVLDPDDSLMKRFQDALREHLVRVDGRLSSEISELEAQIRSMEKEYEAEGLRLYRDQQEIAQQQMTIEKYQNMITNIVSLREGKDSHVREAKEIHRAMRIKLLDEKRKEENLVHELEQLAALQAQFSQWQTELASNLAVSKRASSKNKVLQRELIARKQQKDCIIFKLMEEVWRVKTEIASLDVQLQLKNKEKIEISRMIADANADLEALHRQHVNLCDAWNSVVSNIAKRNKVYEQLNTEREKIRESFNTLHTEMEMLKKKTAQETENNENLTSVHVRVEDNVRVNSRLVDTESDKLDHLQSELVKMAKFSEQEQREFDSVHGEWQCSLYEEEEADKEFARFLIQQNELEDTIYRQLEEKVSHDKAARYLNKLLLGTKETMQEQELLLAETENSYGSKLLELERLNLQISLEKVELGELVQGNAAKGKQVDEIQKEMKKHDTGIERKRVKLLALSKTIEEMLSHTGGEEINPLDMKIITLQKDVEEMERGNRKAQQFWIRREGHMITLSQQRDSQLRELGLLNREIMIMDQKNLKLEHALEMLNREESNMERILNLLQQRATQMSTQLMVQKELKEQLEDKTVVTKIAGLQSLREAELNLIKLRTDLKQLYEEKAFLQDDLDAVKQESLSWEKKVQLTQEAVKKLREERSSGGDIAVMKSEIHKMEMRLSHLRRIQEKLIHDMEFCVTRRDIILDKVMSTFKKDPKGRHNQKVIFTKRLADQKLKIKQIAKDARNVQSRILELESQIKSALEKCNESQTVLKMIKDVMPDVDQGIVQKEAVKYYNLQVLVFKQRKSKMLQDIKSGRYRMIFKSDATLSEEFQNEEILRDYLKNVMERTRQDFPLLQNSVQKILLTLDIL
ncbi:Coiled-coil domain-containing protein [Ooceraea biroi]|nr:Coiled-coil domain-containing protein [Ooceraea biroi]